MKDKELIDKVSVILTKKYKYNYPNLELGYMKAIILATKEALTIPVVMPTLLCIDKSYYTDLTTEKKYTLIEDLVDHYVIKDDGGNECAYKKKLFRICAQ